MSTCTIIEPRHTEVMVSYKYDFLFHEDGGRWFDCDENGNLLNPEEVMASEGWKYCQEHLDELIRPPFVHKLEQTYRVPARAKCSCGAEFSLTDDYCGACACPECGQWYVMNGQAILPPSEWEEPIDDDY